MTCGVDAALDEASALLRQVFVYAINPDNGSPMRKEIERAAEHFVDINPLTAVRRLLRKYAKSLWILTILY